MSKNLRLLGLILFAGLLLVLALAFQQFVMANVILPAATVVWLFLRIFVLSVDQHTYWWGLIMLAVLAALVRLFQLSTANAHNLISDPCLPPRGREWSWRDSILSNALAPSAKDSVKREISWLLASLYSKAKTGSAPYEIREAFLKRQIPLPETVHSFLFASDLLAQTGTSHGAFSRARHAFRAWIRRRTGRELADYVRSIDEALIFMETSMEMKNADSATNVPDK